MLSEKRVRELVRFMRHVLDLKKVPRRGWMERGIDDSESVAEHTYSTLFLALLLARLKGLDEAEVAWLALVHDLPEVVTGDLLPKEKEELGERAEEDEEEALELVARELPRRLGDELERVWRDYREQGTSEARLVKEAELLEMAFQAYQYQEEERFSTAEEFLESVGEQVTDRDVKALLRALYERFGMET